MNGKGKAMQCFQATRDVYLKKGGPKYVVMNQFNCIFYTGRKGKFDSSDLDKNMKELLINSVDISIDATYNEDNEPSEFEIECMEQFEQNLQEYEKNARENMSGMQSDESVASFSSIGSNMSRSSLMNTFDFDSDMDDSSDENDSDSSEIEVVVRRTHRAMEIKDDDSDDDDGNDDEGNEIVYSKRPNVVRGGSNKGRNSYRGRPNRWHRGRGGCFNKRGGRQNNNRITRKDDDDVGSDNDVESDEEQQTQNINKNHYHNTKNIRGAYNNRRGGNRNTRKAADDGSDNGEDSDGNSNTQNFNGNRRGGNYNFNQRRRGRGQRRAQNRGTGQRRTLRRDNQGDDGSD